MKKRHINARLIGIEEAVVKLTSELEQIHEMIATELFPAQQEVGPRSKRDPKSVEGLGVKGEGER